MYKKKIDELFNEILEESDKYRCKYLEILIEKYAIPENDKEIDLQSYRLYKNKNYLKICQTKSIGSVSSYYCESATKNFNYLKKKVLSEKRASLRKQDGASSDEASQCEGSQHEGSEYVETECEESDSEKSECNNRKQKKGYLFKSTTKKNNRIHSDGASSDEASQCDESQHEESEYEETECEESDYEKSECYNRKQNKGYLLKSTTKKNNRINSDGASSSEELDHVKLKKNLKYSSDEASQCEESQHEESEYEETECEESDYEKSECNNRKRNKDYLIKSTTKMNNRIHSGKIKPSISSNSAKTSSKKQNTVFSKNETKKSLAVNDQNYSSSENIIKQFSNSDYKNGARASKSKNKKKLKILIENFSSGNCNALKIEYGRVAVHFKDMSLIGNREKRNNSSASANSIEKSFYTNSLSKPFPKFSLSNIGIGIPNKFCQDPSASNSKFLSNKSAVSSKFSSGKNETKAPINDETFNVCNAKSLHYSSSKSVVSSEVSCNKIGIKTPNKNCRTLQDCLPVKATCPLPSVSVNIENSEDVKKIKQKQVSSERKLCEKKSSTKSTLSRGKTYNSPNKNCRTLQDCFPVKATCPLPSVSVNIENSEDVKKIKQRQVSSERKLCEKKLSIKSTLSCEKTYNSKKYKDYCHENIPIDDLSFRRVSNKKKTDKHK